MTNNHKTLQQLLAELCPTGVPFKKLGEVTAWDKKFNGVDKKLQAKVIPYKYLLAKEAESIEVEGGDVFILNTGNKIAWTTQEKAGAYLADGEVISIPWGGYANVKYYNGRFVTTDNRICTSLDTSVLLNKFLYYYLKHNQPTLDSFYRGAGIKHPSMLSVLSFEIPVPPMAVQERIVEILDNFTALTAELQAELQARQKQYEYFRNRLLTFGGLTIFIPKQLTLRQIPPTYKLLKMSEIFSTITDFTAAGSFASNAKNVVYLKGEDYAMLVRTTDIKSHFSKGDFVFINEHAYNYLWRVQLNSCGIVMPNVGNCGEVYYLTPQTIPYNNACLGPNALWLKDCSQNIKFVYYILATPYFQEQLRKITSPSGQSKFNKTQLKELVVPIPPLAEQQRIVDILDRFEALTSDLSAGLPAEIEARQKQYEYYRNRLLTFQRSNA